MTIKNALASLAVSMVLGASAARAADVNAATAAHLALHRMERLVSLKKVDEAFVTKFHKMTVAGSNAEAGGFRVVIAQYPGSDGTASTLEILLDAAGKPMKETVTPGAAAEGAPEWPDKGPVALVEAAQHHLLHGQGQPELAPYLKALSAIEIAQIQDDAENPAAQIDFASPETPAIYRAVVSTGGDVLSSGIVGGR